MRAIFVPKCDANCDANRPYSSFLWLRNNIFYYSIEVARVNGKRRYKRISLRTDNYYKAREMMKQINEKQPKALIDKLRFLYNQLIFDTEIIVDGPAGSYGMARQVKTLSKRNEITLLRERIIPINDQLVDLGFVDFFNRQKARLKASNTKFIFSRCQTTGGKYNNKYTTRVLMPFFKEIGIKSGDKDQKDFHSFRKNASIGMQDAGVGLTYINDIIGWDGEGMMAEAYSNHTLSQIKEQMDKFKYDFLQPHFDVWKQIMAEK